MCSPTAWPRYTSKSETDSHRSPPARRSATSMSAAAVESSATNAKSTSLDGNRLKGTIVRLERGKPQRFAKSTCNHPTLRSTPNDSATAGSISPTTPNDTFVPVAKTSAERVGCSPWRSAAERSAIAAGLTPSACTRASSPRLADATSSPSNANNPASISRSYGTT